MGTKVFISFRFDDGNNLKQELVDLFDSSTEVINRSENENRSGMTEETIQKYLYNKLKDTSVTIVLLTPNAVDYKKNIFNQYDDWLYDELRYSLEDRVDNRTNGVVAVYTDDSVGKILKSDTHTCSNCGENSNCSIILNFDNLVRKNLCNVKDEYKNNMCKNIYDIENDSYITLVHIDEFKKNFSRYIDGAKEKRKRINEFCISKKM